MKKFIIPFVILFIPLLSTAQLKKEAGLLFTNPVGVGNLAPFEQLGLSLKLGSANALWRMNLERASIAHFSDLTENQTVRNSSLGFDMAFGREWRKSGQRNFSFIYGADFLIGMNSAKTLSENEIFVRRSKNLNMSYGLGAFLGVNYDLGEHFVFGLNYRPELLYSTFKSERESGSEGFETTSVQVVRRSLNLNFVNNNVLFSASYKF